MDFELLAVCRTIARQTLARRGWTLVEDEAAFAEAVLVQVNARLAHVQRPRLDVIEASTVYCYGFVWHAACGENRTPRQRRAFQELYPELYRAVVHLAQPDIHLAEDATQQALLQVWLQHHQVRDPGSFLAWARMIAIHELDDLRCGRAGGTTGLQVVPLTEVVTRGEAGSSNATDDEESRHIPLTDPPSVEADERLDLETVVRRCLTNEQQQTVILGLYLANKSIKQLADELGIKPRQVSLDKHRALDRLRRCDAFLRLVETKL